jgi:hypothetical protein
VFKNTSVIAVAAVLVFAHAASAQNFSFDARRIGMGSPGGGQNLGSKMIQEENKYIAIPLPFGLIRCFRASMFSIRATTNSTWCAQSS